MHLAGVWYRCAQYFLPQAAYVGSVPLHDLVFLRLGGSLGAVTPTADRCEGTGFQPSTAFTTFGIVGLSVDPRPWFGIFVDAWLGVAVPSDQVVFGAIGGGLSFAIPTR